MKEEKNNINYSAEDIRDYLDGKLSDPEMQAMEKAALEDPFLADAIEGIEESKRHPVSFESGVADLQKRLADRISQKKRKGVIPWLPLHWQIAASVLFIIGTAWFTITLINKKSLPANVAISIKKDSGAETTTPQPSVKAAEDTANRSIIKFGPPIIRSQSERIEPDKKAEAERKSIVRKISPTEESKKRSVMDDTQVVSSATHLSRQFADTEKEKISSDSMVFRKSEIAAAPEIQKTLSEKATGLEFSKDKNLSANYVKGIVLNEKGDPVPGATVSLAKTNYGTTTDSNGYFKLYMRKEDSVRKLNFNSVGFVSISKNIKTDSSFTNRIQLQPSAMSLNEVVVTGYGSTQEDKLNDFYESGSRKKKSASEPDSVKNKYVAPVTGWKEFSQYINNNKKIAGADSLLKGIEVISFMVDEKGQLSSFKIHKTISSGHDAAVLNIIKSTGWKILKGKKQKCTVSVLYE